MYYIKISAFAPTTSFRIPETHTFQQTLPLPPPTTLIGLLGAALGLSFEQAMHYKKENQIRFGIIGKSEGKYKDLWKYRKIKQGEILSAVLLKEYLYNFQMELYIVANDLNIVEEVKTSFQNPYYALTLGSSDDLLKIIKVGDIKEAEKTFISNFCDTILPGDYSSNYIANFKIEEIPILQEIHAPQVHLLPTDFDFNGEKRHIKRREPFTIVNIPIKLKEPIEGLHVDGREVALL